MACRSSLISKTTRGEKSTSANPNLTFPVKVGTIFVRLHHLFLAPLIILGIPSEALVSQNPSILAIILLAGLAGAVLKRRRLILVASGSLLTLVIWGKVAADLLNQAAPDTALFLIEFGLVVFLMEASIVVFTFDDSRRELKERRDELSKAHEIQLQLWLRIQLSRQSMIAVGSIGLSVALLPLAGFTSISSNQLPLTATLLLLAIIAFLFLITHRREPEELGQ